MVDNTTVKCKLTELENFSLLNFKIEIFPLSPFQIIYFNLCSGKVYYLLRVLEEEDKQFIFQDGEYLFLKRSVVQNLRFFVQSKTFTTFHISIYYFFPIQI